jgi:hypothetical protein
MTVMTFFESIFAVEQTGANARVVAPYRLDDAFFEHYAEHLAELFLYGVTGMTRMSRESKGRRKARASKSTGRARSA